MRNLKSGAEVAQKSFSEARWEKHQDAQVFNQEPLKSRAGNRIRTGDLLITSQLLYQLSYAGT
jgi:hypothetical protein